MNINLDRCWIGGYSSLSTHLQMIYRRKISCRQFILDYMTLNFEKTKRLNKQVQQLKPNSSIHRDRICR